MNITQYTEKSFVVRMDPETEAFTNKMIELGGKYNEFLRGGNGWIFPNFKKQFIDSYIENNSKSSSKNEDNFIPQPRLKSSSKNEDINNNFSSPGCCTCNCVDRVNKLENTILILHKSIDSLEKKLEKLKPNTTPNINCDDYEEEFNYVPHVRLLNTRK